MTGPAAAQHVRGNVTTLHAHASNIDGAAGYAVYIDGGPAAAGSAVQAGPSVELSSSATITVAGLPIGRHRLSVVAIDPSGRRVSSAVGSISVTVDGPATTATWPSRVAPGQSVEFHLSTFGYTVVDVPGDTSGNTAHYEVFVDSAAPRAGAVVTAAEATRTASSVIEVSSLTTGTHVIWIVLADGANRVVSPLVGVRAQVTVKGSKG